MHIFSRQKHINSTLQLFPSAHLYSDKNSTAYCSFTSSKPGTALCGETNSCFHEPTLSPNFCIPTSWKNSSVLHRTTQCRYRTKRSVLLTADQVKIDGISDTQRAGWCIIARYGNKSRVENVTPQIEWDETLFSVLKHSHFPYFSLSGFNFEHSWRPGH